MIITLPAISLQLSRQKKRINTWKTYPIQTKQWFCKHFTFREYCPQRISWGTPNCQPWSHTCCTDSGPIFSLNNRHQKFAPSPVESCQEPSWAPERFPLPTLHPRLHSKDESSELNTPQPYHALLSVFWEEILLPHYLSPLSELGLPRCSGLTGNIPV